MDTADFSLRPLCDFIYTTFSCKNTRRSVAYEEVCGNLMIFQQLEPICQPINSTFYMELYYNITFTFTYLLAHLL